MPSSPPIEDVALIAQRLAVLLGAGVPPHAAWRYLDDAATRADEATGVSMSRSSALAGVLRWRTPAARTNHERSVRLTQNVLSATSRAATRGENVSVAILHIAAASRLGAQRHRSEQAWSVLAAAWAVAHDSGAPLASTLRELASSFRDQAQLERDLEVALSGPRATARMVGWMPAVAVLFGAAMGFDTVNTLLFTAPGLICLALGITLMLIGARWSNALVRRAAGSLSHAGLLAQLVAIAMSGGAASERARTLAEAAFSRFVGVGIGGELGDASSVDGVLALSRRAGIPAAELLRSEAQQARLEARSAGQKRAARLSVSLMLPLGLCVLPAFLLLGVVPLMIAVLASTLSAF